MITREIRISSSLMCLRAIINLPAEIAHDRIERRAYQTVNLSTRRTRRIRIWL
jgi:hypothetical protein